MTPYLIYFIRFTRINNYLFVQPRNGTSDQYFSRRIVRHQQLHVAFKLPELLHPRNRPTNGVKIESNVNLCCYCCTLAAQYFTKWGKVYIKRSVYSLILCLKPVNSLTIVSRIADNECACRIVRISQSRGFQQVHMFKAKDLSSYKYLLSCAFHISISMHTLLTNTIIRFSQDFQILTGNTILNNKEHNRCNRAWLRNRHYSAIRPGQCNTHSCYSRPRRGAVEITIDSSFSGNVNPCAMGRILGLHVCLLHRESGKLKDSQ